MQHNFDYKFGLLIMDFRSKLNLTRKVASDIIGISPPYLWDIENGNRYPSRDLCKKIINVFNLDEKETRIFYDYLAIELNAIPYDIEEYLLNNPEVINDIISKMNQQSDSQIRKIAKKP